MTRFAPAVLLVSLLALGACSGGDSGRYSYTVSFVGLPDLTGQFGHYEGWVIIGGVARSTGKFVIDGVGPDAIVRDFESGESLGTASSAVFGPTSTRLGDNFPRVEDATHFFVTREDEGDANGQPSCRVVMAGVVNDGDGTADAAGVLVPDTIVCATPVGGGMARLGLGDFAAAAGTFQLRSPTDDVSNGTPNDFAGVWFLKDDGMSGLEPGLALPTLPEGQTYEAWAMVDGVVRSLGRFDDVAAKDLDAFVAPQRGADGPGPDVPGQDLVLSTMPAFAFDPPALFLVGDLVDPMGDYVVHVTVEPARDNDPGPFQLELLSAPIPPDAVTAFGNGTTVDLDPVALPAAAAALNSSSVVLTDLGLRDLGATDGRRGHFELWLEIGGMPVSLAKFVIDGETVQRLDGGATFGTRASSTFDAASTGLVTFPDATTATSCFITLEDEGDADAEPADLVILQGAAAAGMAALDLAGASGTGGRGLADFGAVVGGFTLDSPSNDGPGVPADDDRGLLFGSASGFPLLEVPALPAGWVYEGWVEELATGRFYSTGRFRDPTDVDENDQISFSRDFGPKPSVPGEDFLFDVPTEALNAAQAGSITLVFVTVESAPDAEVGPSPIRVLEATVPAGAVTGGVGGVDVPMTLVFDPAQTSAIFSVNEVN
ncbi:MAG: hypothetical protein R3F20_10170 [Planctomycetota bacterium]